MGISRVEQNHTEMQKAITETLKKQDIDSVKNPILSRCTEKGVDKPTNVHQAYDRMHHRHNRS